MWPAESIMPLMIMTYVAYDKIMFFLGLLIGQPSTDCFSAISTEDCAYCSSAKHSFCGTEQHLMPVNSKKQRKQLSWLSLKLKNTPNHTSKSCPQHIAPCWTVNGTKLSLATFIQQ